MDKLDTKIKILEICAGQLPVTTDTFEMAKKVYEWAVLNLKGDIKAETPATPVKEPVRIERNFTPTPLTKTQKAVMGVIIDAHKNGEMINSVTLGKKLKCTSSNANAHISNLVRLGFLGRKGTKTWPRRTPTGQPIETLEKLPPGKAIGYKG